MQIMETICMNCHILFSVKNMKNIINLSSAEYAQRVVKVLVPCKIWADGILNNCFTFLRK